MILAAALAELRREFPDAELTEVRLEFRTGERHDHGPSETWDKCEWTVQVMNDSARGSGLDEAIASLRAKLGVKALVPERAERVAAVLREVTEYFDQMDVVQAATQIIENEMRKRPRP